MGRDTSQSWRVRSLERSSSKSVEAVKGNIGRRSLFSLIVPLKLVAQGPLPCHHLLLTFVHELDFSMGFFHSFSHLTFLRAP